MTSKYTLLAVFIAASIPAICYGDDDPHNRGDGFDPNPDRIDTSNVSYDDGLREPDFSGLKLFERNDLDREGEPIEGARSKTVGNREESPKEGNADDTTPDESTPPADGEPAGDGEDGANANADEDKPAEGGDAPEGEAAKPPAATEPPKQQEEPKPADDEDEDLKAIQPKRNAPPHVQDGFRALKDKVKEGRAEKVVLEARVKELEERVASIPTMSPEQEAEVKDLKAQVAAFNVEFNPEYRDGLKKPFEDKTEELLKHIDTLLPGALTDGHKKIIRDQQVHHVKPTWWDGLLSRLDPYRKAGVERKLSEAIALGVEMDAFKERVKVDPAKYYEEQQAKHVAQQQEYWDKWGAEARKHGEEMQKELGEWINDKEIPAGATPEQKAAIEAHNAGLQKHVKAIEETAIGLMKQSPRDVTRAAVAVIHAEHLKGENAKLSKERDDLSAEVESLRKKLGAVKTAGRVAAQASASDKAAEVKKPHTSIQDADSAMMAHFGRSV